MPAAAIVCAIWPPMVPAPTTAALNTNMAGLLRARIAERSRVELAASRAKRRSVRSQRVGLRAADEEQVDDGAQRAASCSS